MMFTRSNIHCLIFLLHHLLLCVQSMSTQSELRWSQIASSRCQLTSTSCVIPADETWLLDMNMNVGHLEIRGALLWDVTQTDLVLSVFSILVLDGKLQIGTRENPMLLNSTLYVKQPPAGLLVEREGGERFIVGKGSAIIEMHGRPLLRTWTTLAAHAPKGSTHIATTQHPMNMGWRVGDSIGVVTTSRGDSTVHNIVQFTNDGLIIDPPLISSHLGGKRSIGDLEIETAAEIVNLERSIRITGEHKDFESSGIGLHILMRPAAYDAEYASGYIDIRYTRIEYCGQLDRVGRYCLHLHRMQKCRACKFIGNSIIDSFQAGITIHGTHQSLSSQNVLWDNRGVGIYTEDGNEMNNTIIENAIICSTLTKCRIEWQGSPPKEGGIFLFGMTNNIVGNRVAGHEHGLWTPGASQGSGRGAALQKVCPQFTPFGLIMDNVFHDCNRFGTYLDNQSPRNVVRDGFGYVLEWSTCAEFTEEGEDNGVVPANVVLNQVDYHNIFVGQYSMGDVSYQNYTSLNNLHAMYWKRSKNFADGLSYHISDSRFINDPQDPIGLLQTMLPGGPFVFRMKNVRYYGGNMGCGAICAPQHCGIASQNGGTYGSRCAISYALDDVSFDAIDDSKSLLRMGVSEGSPIAPVFTSRDNSLYGFRSIVSPDLNGFESLVGCQFNSRLGGIACGESVLVRTFIIWTTQDYGTLKMTGPGYVGVHPTENPKLMGANSGYLHYDGFASGAKHFYNHGYGAQMVAGEEYRINGLSWRGDDVVFDFSDPFFGPEAIALTLVLTDGRSTRCTLDNTGSRKFKGTDGVDIGADIGDCGRAFRALGTGVLDVPELDSDSDVSNTDIHTTTGDDELDVNVHSDCVVVDASAENVVLCGHDASVCTPTSRTYFASACLSGGLGCSALGHRCCRFYGFDGYVENKPLCTTQQPDDKPQSPTNPPLVIQTIPDVQYVGCFKDDWPNEPRDLVHWAGRSDAMTPELCNSMCSNVPGIGSKSFYFGVQYSRDCFCDSEGPGTYGGSTDDECDMPCTGNALVACGGDNRNTVYHFQMDEEIVPNIPPPSECADTSATESMVATCGHTPTACGNTAEAYFTVECVAGGLGCSALGSKCCRYYGFGPYTAVTPPCASREGTTTNPTNGDNTTSQTPDGSVCTTGPSVENVQLCHHGAEQCGDPSKAFFTTECLQGGLGCMAMGLPCCRYYGFGAYVDVLPPCASDEAIEPTTDPRDVEDVSMQIPGGSACTTGPSVENVQLCQHSAEQCGDPSKAYFTTDCLHGGLGCMAMGFRCCRYYGFGPYVEISKTC